MTVSLLLRLSLFRTVSTRRHEPRNAAPGANPTRRPHSGRAASSVMDQSSPPP